MKQFKQKLFPGIRYSFKLNDDFTLLFRHSTISKMCEIVIPLYMVDPDPFNCRSPSKLASFFALVGGFCFLAFSFSYYKNPNLWGNLNNFIVGDGLALIVSLISSGIFRFTNRKRILYLYKNHNLAFELLDRGDEKQFKFQELLRKQCYQANLAGDARNLQLMKKELHRLVDKKIISQEFENSLHHRLNSIESISEG